MLKCKNCNLRIMSKKLLQEYHKLQVRFQEKKCIEKELVDFIDTYKKIGYCSEQFVGAGIAFMEHIPKTEDGLPPTDESVGIRPNEL